MEEDNYQILKEWHSLLANGAITQQEFNVLKSELLAKNILSENMKSFKMPKHTNIRFCKICNP